MPSPHPDAAAVPSNPATVVPEQPPAPPRPRRLTIAAGWVTVAICLLHTLAFAGHPYWGAWIAGPLRTTEVTMAEAVSFWGLPGGFVVPGAILGLTIVGLGRRGQRMPRYAGWVLAGWAAACLWMIGPSGFGFVLVPSALLIIADVRARGGSPRRRRTEQGAERGRRAAAPQVADPGGGHRCSCSS